MHGFKRVVCLCVITVLAGWVLCGCSAQHEVIEANTQCVSCHDEKTTYQVATPASAKEVANDFEVTTSAESILVCTPVFISENGSSYVPRLMSQVKVQDGKATMHLSDGTYALATGKTQGKTQLVTVSVNGASELAL